MTFCKKIAIQKLKVPAHSLHGIFPFESHSQNYFEFHISEIMKISESYETRWPVLAKSSAGAFGPGLQLVLALWELGLQVWFPL